MSSIDIGRKRRGLALALLAFSNLITSLDFTIVYVAMPDIGREVGFSSHGLQWVISAYAIFYGGFLLLGGRAADVLGRRRMFLTGMALFGIASLLGGLAVSPWMLIAARVMQGLGAAVLFPATLSLVNTTFAEGRERNRALMVWAMAGALGLSLGALAGGVLTQLVGWEGIFFVNVPLVLIAMFAVGRLLPADAEVSRGNGFDLPGALTGTGGITLAVYAVAHGGEAGFGSPTVLIAAALAVVLLAVFVAIEAKGRSPLMPLRLFRNRYISAAAVVIFVFAGTFQAIIFFLTLHFQDVLGFSPLQAGLAFLVPSMVIMAGDFLAERLMHRFGTRATVITAILLGAAGGVLIAPSMTADGSYLGVLAGILVWGLGMGLIFPSMFAAAGTGVADHEQGTAAGIAATALYVGGPTGIAILVSIANADLGGLTGEALRVATADGLATAVYVAAAGALLGVIAAALLPARDKPAAPAAQDVAVGA